MKGIFNSCLLFCFLFTEGWNGIRDEGSRKGFFFFKFLILNFVRDFRNLVVGFLVEGVSIIYKVFG